jgi:ferric-dicitrate binding protein FerR (iron transport regulator)
MWSVVRERPRAASRLWPVLAVALLAALVVAVRLLGQRPEVAPIAKAPEVTAPKGRRITLADGTVVELSEGAQLKTSAVDQVVLEGGEANFTLARPLKVAVGAWVVDATVGQFTVTARADATTVRAITGDLKISERDQVVATLGAGQSWSSPVHTAPAPSNAVPAPSLAPPSKSGPTAKTLFEAAAHARVMGNHVEAAASLAKLIQRFPDDARAPIAAYQLGRIRLGSLHDPRGAVTAFEFAIAHGKGAPFALDAEVGRVEALGAAGELSACRAARDAFLAAHPASDLRKRVERACGPA